LDIELDSEAKCAYWLHTGGVECVIDTRRGTSINTCISNVALEKVSRAPSSSLTTVKAVNATNGRAAG